ncbi:hypothetical protein HYC85_012428 [Camellia sinensis]|uniref:Uncharacterized protein n=1 Tax=Camellia sinensis TaxID=4442 RepID=A0A7J7HCU3_CAMSI|nr:hypothetical protein HYC85_012428 [Camellia sinensis]
MLRVTICRRILCRASSLQRCFRSLWNQILACTLGKSCTYRQLPRTTTMWSPSLVASKRGFETRHALWTMYVGGERQEEGFEISNSGLNQMDKTLYIGGGNISLVEFGRLQTAIPVLTGTKFNDFVQLPIDVQWTIASQARAYARALNATLLFSRATYNINVNKIFKFITAKLFNLPWAPERNLTIGEPIIDF